MLLRLPESNFQSKVVEIIYILRNKTRGMDKPAVMQIVAEFGKSPFLVLISCLLSLRAKDSISLPVSRKLFQIACTPAKLAHMPLYQLENILFSIGFYRKKARQLISVSKELIERFDGIVPDNFKDLVSIKGVGPKTANIVLAEAFNIPAIAVDTHVHRIANRLGLVNTKTPEQTETELKKIVPRKYWSDINPLFVMWGQNVCEPISPWCSKCALLALCPRIGVKRSR